MSRLDIKTASKAQTVVDRLYKDMERRIASSPPGLCPIDMSLTFLQLCHAQSCGKCVPCRIGLGQLSILMGQVLDGTGTMLTIDTIEKTARAIVASADCAIGRDAAQLVLSGFEGFRDDYVNHVQHHRCLASLQNPVPCVSLCPAGVDVPGYVALVREGRYADAVRLIRKDNPMPTACAYICEHPCEARCRRNMVDAPINIRGLKRYAVDHAGDVPNPACGKSTGKRVAIIGGGPSGLSCAYYLRLMGHSVTIFEEKKQLGGMLRYGIPSFKLEKDVIDAEIDIIKAMGVEIKCGIEVGKDVTLDELRAQGYKAFYIAIGCQGGRKAGIPGEDAEGVMTAVDFLRTVGADESYPVTGKAVVVGGGNVAIDVARTAQRCGAESVAMFCLEPRDKMPASEEEIAEALEEDVTIDCGWGPKEIHLDEAGRVCGITFKRCTRVFDDEGRFAPEYDENDLRRVDADRVVMSIGQPIVWGDLLAGSKVELGRGQGALADPQTYQTAEPDIFVGGDVYTGQKFAIDAIAAGKQGAVSLHRWVQDATLTIGRDKREFIELDKNNLLLEEASYDNTPRQRIGYNETLRKTFKDGRVAFTEEQVKAETARCLGCGASVVDPNKCIGCGICTTRCAFDAIHLHRDLPECSTMRSAEDKMKGILPYMIKRKIRIRRAKKAEKRNG